MTGFWSVMAGANAILAIVNFVLFFIQGDFFNLFVAVVCVVGTLIALGVVASLEEE